MLQSLRSSARRISQNHRMGLVSPSAAALRSVARPSSSPPAGLCLLTPRSPWLDLWRQDKVSELPVGDAGITRPGEFIFAFLAELNITTCGPVASQPLPWRRLPRMRCFAPAHAQTLSPMVISSVFSNQARRRAPQQLCAGAAARRLASEWLLTPAAVSLGCRMACRDSFEVMCTKMEQAADVLVEQALSSGSKRGARLTNYKISWLADCLRAIFKSNQRCGGSAPMIQVRRPPEAGCPCASSAQLD